MPTPAEILEQMQRPDRWDGWVPTYSGAGYRPWDDDPGPLHMDDLAYGLAHTYRYGGQAVPGITVAEHSVLTAQIVATLWPGNLHLTRAALLHDAAESVLHDIQGPLRSRVRVHLADRVLTWSESDRLVTGKIARYFGVTDEHLDAPEIRAADILAVCFEKRDCSNLGDEDWGLPEIPPEIEHLRMCFQPPAAAMHLFRAQVQRLGITTS